MTDQSTRISAAETIARHAHLHQHDKDDCPHIDHVERVVGMVPDDCKPLAWLHDVVEDCPRPDWEAIDAVLDDDEHRALRVLTRIKGQSYDGYIKRIRGCDGHAGILARAVKEADLIDNYARCLRDIDGEWSRGRLHLYRKAIRELWVWP